MLTNLDEADQRSRVLALVRRHGYNATSFQALEPACRYWFSDDDACVAYVDTGSAWVAAGAPIADVTRLDAVSMEFVAAAVAHDRRACFFGAEARFLGATNYRATQIGQQPVWDPTAWQRARPKTSVREQLRRARAKGVTVRRLSVDDVLRPELRSELEAVTAAWLREKAMAKMGFLVDVQLFHFPDEREYFVAQRDDRIVGFLAAVPVYMRQGWFFEDLVRLRSAPNGTSELLIDTAMRHLGSTGCRWATLGMVPLAGTRGWLKRARTLTAPLYDFAGLERFRAKLEPMRVDPVFLAHPESTPPALAIFDVLRSFAPSGFVSFGLATVAKFIARAGRRALRPSADVPLLG